MPGARIRYSGTPAYNPLMLQFDTASATGLNTVNNWACVGGVGGAPPQLADGSTVVFLGEVSNTGAQADFATFGLLASNRGWSVGISTAGGVHYHAFGATVVDIAFSSPSTFLQKYVGCAAMTITGGNLRASINGSAVVTAAAPAYTNANAGDTFKIGSNLDGGSSGATTIYVFAIFNRVFPDAELQSVSGRALNDNRYDFEYLAGDPNCQVFFSTKKDWGGAASPITIRGNLALVMTKAGNPTYTAFTEVVKILSPSEILDSGTDYYRVAALANDNIHIRSEYAVTRVTAGDTKFVGDFILDAGASYGPDVYTAGSFTHTIGSGDGNPGDGHRHMYQFTAVAGTVYEIVDGFQAGPNPLGSAPPFVGSWLRAIRYKLSAPWVVTAAPAYTRRLVVLGDSIVGSALADLGQHGWVRLARVDFPGRITLIAYGNRSVTGDIAQGQAVSACINALGEGACATQELWIELGINDGSDVSAGYLAIADAVHAQLPNVKMYFQTPTTTLGEPITWLTNYRANIATGVTARAGWTVPPVLVQGPTMFTGTPTAGGPHPGTAQHAQMKTAAKTALGY